MSHAEAIQENRAILQRCTTINSYVIDYLRAEYVIDEAQEHDLLTERNLLKQRILLFQWLKEVSSDKYESFLKVMKDTEQEHVANHLRGSTEDDHLPLSDARYERLLNIRHKMAHVIRIDNEVIAELRRWKTISKTDVDEIRAEKVDYTKVSKLINAIMRRSNHSYDSFQEVLRDTLQTAAANFLIEGEMLEVHLNNNRPDLDVTLANSLNKVIRNNSEGDKDTKERLAEMNGFGVNLVRAIPGQSIVIFIYCKTVQNAVKFTQLFNSGRLQCILDGILNRLLLRVEPSNKEPLDSRIILEDDDIISLEDITGIEGWMRERRPNSLGKICGCHASTQTDEELFMKKNTVAASFVDKEVVEFKGQRMLVTKHEDHAVNAGHGEDNDDNASAKELPSSKYTVSGSFNTLRVSGISQNASKEMISMYFENRKQSGGGRLRVLEYQKEKGKAVFKFDNPEDGLEVCKRTHVLSGKTLKISALEMLLDDVKSCAIEVKGLGERTNEDFLELYFENKRRSGGGTVEKVFLNKETGSAIVVFEEATAVLGVMKNQSHILDGVKLEVNVLEPAPPPPLLLSDVDTNRLLAKRLPPSTTRESLREYLSPAAKANMVGWTLAVKPSTALLEFSSEPDYVSIRRLVCSKPFLGKMFSIRRVPLTSSILVTGIPSSIKADFVEMYFENSRSGNTEEDCRVEMLPDKGSAIVEFERPDVIHTITSRRHQFGKQEVKVEPYYPWLGIISVSESSGQVPAKTNSEIAMTSLTFTFDPGTMHFIVKRPDLQKQIEDSLEKLNCYVEFPSKGKGEVKLEFKGKEKQKPTTRWEVECKKVLQGYADELTWKKENFLMEIWNYFKMQLQEYVVKKSELLDVAFENDLCIMQYIGLKKDTDEFEELFSKIKGKLEEELQQRKKRISETVTNLRPHQLDLIRTEEFQKNLRQEITDLEFEVKQTEVNLCGMLDVVEKTKIFILEKVIGAAQDSFEISESQSKVFAKDEAKPYLMEQLLGKGISASWKCNDRRIDVYALDDKDLTEAIEVLKKEVVEVTIQLSKSSEALVQSSQWKKFVESLYTDYKSLEVMATGLTVVAACTRNIADGVQIRLNGFIQKYAILEKLMSVDFGVIDMITNYMKDELQKMESELKECSGGIDTSKDEPGFIITGNKNQITKAAKDLQGLIDRIVMCDHDIDRPGIPAYFYSKRGKEALRSIQLNHKVLIQLHNTQSRAKRQAVAGDRQERYRLEVRPGKFMILIRGVITKCSVDAVVTEANENLKHYGGVAAAIAKAAGPELEEDCLVRIKFEGPLLPGQVCVTRSGKLPCKKVIHALGPSWSGGNAEEENILAMAVYSSLNAADNEGLKSIAMPLISTGLFGFPLDRATDIIVDTVSSYLADNSSTTVREVFFTDNYLQAVDSLERKLKTIEVDGLRERPKTKKGGTVAGEPQDSRPSKNEEPPLNTSQRGSFGALSKWNWSKVHGRSNYQDGISPVDDGEFSEDHSGVTQEPRTMADPRQQSEEPREEIQPRHLSRIMLKIYALSKEAIDDVLRDIEEVIRECLIDKVLDSPQDQESMAKLNPEHVKRIKDIANIFPVQIELETGCRKRIRIHGPPIAVTSVIDQVHNIFQEANQKEIQEKEEKWIANVAYWEYEDGNDFERYPDEINAIIEKAYRDRKPYVEWEEEMAKYRVIFQTMMEEFMTHSGKPPVKVRRVAKDMDIPAYWDKMKDDEDLKKVQLNASDQEFKDVAKSVLTTANTTVNQIVKIERIQNKMLYKQYVVRKAAMDAANPQVQNEMTLWHGTREDTLESINRHGFNRYYCGKNAVAYGRGVYFDKIFSYTAQNTYAPPDANGYKHVYQCKVLTGEYAVGNQSMIVPPFQPESTTIRYNSTVDNVTNPTIFVIYYDNQACPEYLIYFK